MAFTAFLLAVAMAFTAVDDLIGSDRVQPAASRAPVGVLFDTTHGATLWAVGASYKSAFNLSDALHVEHLP